MTLREAIKILAEHGVSSPREDAAQIFRCIGGIPPHRLVSLDVTCEEDSVKSAINRRAQREPLQYIIGSVEFYRETYKVTPDCLIPRPDTELLVDFAVNNLPHGCRFIDLCTGSGCIAVSTLRNTAGTHAVALDISPAAIRLAESNARENGVLERIEFVCADALTAVPDGQFYAVLSNPPYVSTSAYAELDKEIYFEPKAAFVGGNDGGDFYRTLTPLYREKLAEGGFIAYEIGYDQQKMISDIAEIANMSCEIIKDYSGNPRVAVLRHK